MQKNKKIVLIVSAIIILILSGIVITFLMLKNNNKERNLFTGIITNIQGENIIARDIEDGTYYSVTYKDNNFQIGDTITVYTKDAVKETYPVGVSASKIILLESFKEEQTNKSDTDNDNIETNSKETSSNNSTNNTNDNPTNNSSATTSKPKTEQDVISYFSTLNSNLDSNESTTSLANSIKKGFITMVDFLFYDGTIYGYTFSNLTNSAKIQVLKLAGLIDTKIDKYFPGYKESISNTTGRIYTSIKEKVVTTYLDVTTTICTNDKDLCETARSDFASLKESFGLTWDFIKSIASAGINKLSEWYITWSYQYR